MNKEHAIEYITGADWRKSRLGLDRISELMGRLGNPQDKLRFIHVAGTNGKGSTSCMLAEILAAAGICTGLFTSPYVNRFNERMQVDGRQISDDDVARLTGRVRRHADAMADHPTEFELVCAVGFLWFLECGCQMVVLEVGLGGRLDATNVIAAPELTVITTIDYDHTQQLGDTLPKIAAEKAGIIKQGSRVILYPQLREVEEVIKSACAKCGAGLTAVSFDGLRLRSHTLQGQIFDYGGLESLEISLLGPYQPYNAATAITAVRALRCREVDVSDTAIRNGLARVRWPARFEILKTEPAVILDGGHNPQCVRELVKGLKQYFPGQRFVFVAGVMADKEYGTMFSMIAPLARQVFCVAPDNPRALPSEESAAFFRHIGAENVCACTSVRQGIKAALKSAGADTPICAFGSFYMAGDVRACFGI